MLKILNSQSKSLGYASAIVGGAYFLSALVGILRDRLLASRFGASDELDIYYAAFRLPDFVAMILIMGAISAAIIPIFSQKLAKSDDPWRFASGLINFFFIFSAIVSFAFAVFAPLIVSLITPGFEGEKREAVILLTRIMFLSPVILGVSNIFSAFLQVFHRFLAAAMAPILYNLGIIFGVIFFVPLWGLSGLAWGVVLGGLLHLLIQLPALLTSGFRFKIASADYSGIWPVAKLAAPRVIGLAASQINLIVITAAASLFAGAVAIFNLANNISFAAVSLAAVSISTASFPGLTMAFSKGNSEEFSNRISLAGRRIIFLLVPLSVLIFLLRSEIVAFFLGAGNFSRSDIDFTASCLAVLSFGLLAQGLVLLFSRAFYARHNSGTPALLAVLAVLLNIFLIAAGFGFFGGQRVWQGPEAVWLGLSFSISSIAQAFFMLWIFAGKISLRPVLELIKVFAQTVLAGVIMWGAGRFFLKSVDGFFSQNFIGLFFKIISTGLISSFIFLAVMLFIKNREVIQIIGFLQNKWKKKI